MVVLTTLPTVRDSLDIIASSLSLPSNMYSRPTIKGRCVAVSLSSILQFGLWYNEHQGAVHK